MYKCWNSKVNQCCEENPEIWFFSSGCWIFSHWKCNIHMNRISFLGLPYLYDWACIETKWGGELLTCCTRRLVDAEAVQLLHLYRQLTQGVVDVSPMSFEVTLQFMTLFLLMSKHWNSNNFPGRKFEQRSADWDHFIISIKSCKTQRRMLCQCKWNFNQTCWGEINEIVLLPLGRIINKNMIIYYIIYFSLLAHKIQSFPLRCSQKGKTQIKHK